MYKVHFRFKFCLKWEERFFVLIYFKMASVLILSIFNYETAHALHCDADRLQSVFTASHSYSVSELKTAIQLSKIRDHRRHFKNLSSKSRIVEIATAERLINEGKPGAWANSTERVIWILKRLSLRPDIAKEVLDDLFLNSSLLKHAIRPKTSKTGLITFSLEKEGRNFEIANYYRVSKYTEAEWFELAPAERFRHLFFAKKMNLPIEDTIFKPDYLGEFSAEITTLRNTASNSNGNAYEVRHEFFDVDLESFTKHIDEIGKDLGYQELHFHIVTEIPKNYPAVHFNQMMDWVKQGNDYLFFNGLAEGLHPTWLTSAASFHEISERDQFRFRGGDYKWDRKVGVLPSKMEEVDGYSCKYFCMAPRTQIYGKSIDPQMFKFSVELRDFTRKPETLKTMTRKVAHGFGQEIWLNKNADTRERSYTFDERRESALALFDKAGFDPTMAQSIHDENIFSAVPLQEFENGDYFNYQTARWFKPNKLQKVRIISARLKYQKALKDLENEYQNYQKKGERVTQDELDMVIKMIMVDWARESRVNELFQYL